MPSHLETDSDPPSRPGILRPRYLFGALVLAGLAGYLLSALPGRTPSRRTLHYTTNIAQATSTAAALGFDLFDVSGDTSRPGSVNAVVDRLPAGAQALVWVGNLDNAPPGSPCPAPGFSERQFTAQVDALAGNPRVYGYYIADEPHPSVCPGAVADVKARADYIHAHAPGQKAFIVVQDGSGVCHGSLGCEYRALRPSQTDVDLVGLDPYPCHYGPNGSPVPCDDTVISRRVEEAVGSGIPANAIVPVFQAFGEAGRTDGRPDYYRLPSPTELTAMLDTWSSLVPDPAFDFFYTFGRQCSPSSCPAPQAIVNTPDLQTVVTAHNRR